MSPENVCAIALAQGSATSHAAILARALRIPAVAGLGPRLLKAVREDDPLIVDGQQGSIVLRADARALADARQQAGKYRTQRAAIQARGVTLREQSGQTRDGQRVLLLANVGNAADARAAAEVGAEGIGLLRTEYLFAQSAELPDEQTQAALYTEIVTALGPRRGPVIVRTLDVGGDKPLPALTSWRTNHAAEANPALGLRGIRLQTAIPGLLATQLRAIALAAQRAKAEMRVMLPMITTVSEVREAKAIVRWIHQELADATGSHAPQLALGIMVETPAAVFTSDVLAEEAAFFSIGANDRTQYVMAVDRLNPDLATLCDPMQPAVLRAISHVVQVARTAKRPVSVCGEMASDPPLALLLVGLGVASLSMAPASIPAVKEALAGKTIEELRSFADRALRLPTLDDVRHLLGELRLW